MRFDRILGALLLAGVLIVGWHQLRPDDAVTSALPPPAQRASAAGGLSPDEARSWCAAGPCDQHQFAPLIEANGAVNPNGVHMTTGNPVVIDLPAGVAADVWDCFAASQITGPATLPQVCEATFRRI